MGFVYIYVYYARLSMAIASKYYECLSNMILLHRVVKKHVCANGVHDVQMVCMIMISCIDY